MTPTKVRLYVIQWLTTLLATVVGLTKIPIPINAAATWEAIKLAVAENYDDLKAAAEAAAASAKNRISQLTDELTAILVADVNSYRNGLANAITPSTQTTHNATSRDVARWVHDQAQRCKTLIAAIPGLIREGWIAFAVGTALIFVSAFGVMHPIIKDFLGANGEVSALTAGAWAVIFSTAIALTVGAITVIFSRNAAVRLSPWAGVFIAAALFFLVGRYVAASMSSDFLLMKSLPMWTETAIRIGLALGTAAALICVELGAGRALAFFWIRYQTKTDLPRLQEILRDVTEWNRLRAEFDEQSRTANRTLNVDDLCKAGARVVAESIDENLATHNALIREMDGSVTQPYTGSEVEYRDRDYLVSQVKLCENARDELLRLAGLNPPTAPATPTTSPLPPAPPAATIATATNP